MSRSSKLDDFLAAGFISPAEHARLMPSAKLADQQDAYGRAAYQGAGTAYGTNMQAMAQQTMRSQQHLAQRMPAAPVVPALPSVEALTRAIFDTDHEVRSHARLNGEVPPFGRYGGSFENGVAAAKEHARLEAVALGKAWARAIFGYQPERGWAETAKVRALLLRDALKVQP